MALHDEEFEIRELALCTIARLSSFNPAYIMPSLRKTIIQILTELEYSGVGRNKVSKRVTSSQHVGQHAVITGRGGYFETGFGLRLRWEFILLGRA